MTDTTIYDTTVPTEGPLALAHQRIIRVKRGGVFENITGDVNNLLLNPSQVIVPREVYGTKGTQSRDVIGYNFAPTFSVEAVRDPATKQIVVAQPWLGALISAGYATGSANKLEVQIFDGLDESLPAFEGTYSIAVADANAGFADKAIYNFTLTSDGVVQQIDSPIAGTGEPILESASPSGLTVGDIIVVRGYKLGSTVSATIDAQSVLKVRIVDDNTITLLIPASVAGSAPIIVTNGVGASASLAYTAA